MTTEVSKIEHFTESLRGQFRLSVVDQKIINIRKNQRVYAAGDEDNAIYYVESGRVKTLLTARSGKECLLAIHTAGEIFGESIFAKPQNREDTAITMANSTLRCVSQVRFLSILRNADLIDGWTGYLAARLAEQWRIIAELVTVDSEHRLAATLLRLATKLGTHDPNFVRIEHRISPEDLSQMVGTTRPRISEFMHKFHKLGLVQTSAERHLIVRESMLQEYLDRRIAAGA